jgi:hypothetical protein
VRFGGEAFGLLLPLDCVWISARASAESEPHGFYRLALAANRSAELSTFAAEQSAKTASRRSSNFSFFEDALLIFSRVGPPLWFGNYFGVRPSDSDFQRSSRIPPFRPTVEH